MAIPNIEISIIPVNQIVIKNNDVVTVNFTVEKCNDAGTGFDPYIPASLVSNTVEAGTENQFSVPDDLYKINFQDTEDAEVYHSYYFLADHNIKACKRDLLIKNLCNTSFGCDPKTKYEYLDLRMRFRDLEDGLYYIYSKFIGKQSLTMLLVPTNQELLTKKDYLTQLLALCGCKNHGCGCNATASSSPKIHSGCGCK